jgi:hypothetical protein
VSTAPVSVVRRWSQDGSASASSSSWRKKNKGTDCLTAKKNKDKAVIRHFVVREETQIRILDGKTPNKTILRQGLPSISCIFESRSFTRFLDGAKWELICKHSQKLKIDRQS